MSEIYTRFGVTYANVESPQTLTDGTGDSLANDLALEDTAQPLVLNVTASQYIKLLSAALNGAERHWPTEYISVIYPLIKAGKMSEALCEAIAACIADDTSGTYEALNDWLLAQLAGNTDVQDALTGLGLTGSTPVPGVTTSLIEECDLDLLFGFCRQTVKMMNRLVLDAFEILEVITNWVEFTVAVAELIPPATTVATYVSYLQNTLVENYIANYDETYENELACELFCHARANEDCTLNWFEITDILASRLTVDITGQTIQDLLAYAVTGSWSGDQFCDLSLLSLAFILQLGGDWTGVSFRQIQTLVQSYTNDEDADWATLCPCGWQFTEQFVSSTGVFDWYVWPAGWTPTQRGALGTMEDLQDTQNVYTSLDRRFEGIAIQCDLASAANFTRVLFNYEAGVDTPGNSKVQMYNGATEVYLQEFVLADTEGTPATIDLDMDVNADKVIISLVSGFKVGSNPGSSCNLPFVTFQGSGTKPAEFT